MYFLYHLIKHSQVSLKLKIKLFQLALPLEAVVWTGIIRFSDAFSDIFDLRCMFVPLKSFIFSSQMHHRPPTGRLTKYVRREEVISYANCWVYDIKHPFNSSPNLFISIVWTNIDIEGIFCVVTHSNIISVIAYYPLKYIAGCVWGLHSYYFAALRTFLSVTLWVTKPSSE